MLLELARPLMLLAIILALLMLFHAAFLEPASTFERLEDALGPLLLSAGAAMVGGFVFLPSRRARVVPISRQRAFWTSFPIRVFCWGTLGMALLFVAAWYFETYLLPYRNTR